MRSVHLIFTSWVFFILLLAYLTKPSHIMDLECYDNGTLVYKGKASIMTTWNEVTYVTEYKTNKRIKLKGFSCMITKITERNND